MPVTSFDPDAIPSDPEERILRIPLPKRFDGTPVYDRAMLRAAERQIVSKAHEAKVRETLKMRAMLLRECERDYDLRLKVNEQCRRSPAFFINHFGFSYDDREEDPVTPLILFDKQEQGVIEWHEHYVKEATKRVTWIDEKSRAWGWTWVAAVMSRLWAFLYINGWTVLYGNDKLEKLDDGGLKATHQTTFGKIRFAMRNLPSWMLPPGLIDDERLNKIGLIKHPLNNNMLKADFYSTNFGRGDRYSDVVCDEAASSQNFGAAETSFKQTTRRVHIGTTPRGRDNDFGRLRHGAQKKHVRTLHWLDNPKLGPDWYWEQREHYTRAQAAQELDIDYDQSVSLRVYPNFDRSKAVRQWVEVNGERQRFDYDPLLPLYLAVDPGFDDPFAFVWIQENRLERGWRIVDHLQRSGRPGLFYVPFITGEIPEVTNDGDPWPYEYSADEREMIARHKEWDLPREIVGGSDGGAATVHSEKPMYEQWEEYGVRSVDCVSFAGRGGDKDDAIRMVELAIPRISIAGRLETQRIGGPAVPTIVECFEQYSWVDRSNNPSGRKTKREPKHDVYCHAMDAVQMFFADKDLEPVVQTIRKPRAPRATMNPDAVLPKIEKPLLLHGQEIDPIAQE